MREVVREKENERNITKKFRESQHMLRKARLNVQNF